MDLTNEKKRKVNMEKHFTCSWGTTDTQKFARYLKKENNELRLLDDFQEFFVEIFANISTVYYLFGIHNFILLLLFFFCLCSVISLNFWIISSMLKFCLLYTSPSPR